MRKREPGNDKANLNLDKIVALYFASGVPSSEEITLKNINQNHRSTRM